MNRLSAFLFTLMGLYTVVISKSHSLLRNDRIHSEDTHNDSCVVITDRISCSECLTFNNTWCDKYNKCFSNADAKNAAICEENCDINLIVNKDDCKTSDDSISIFPLFFSFLVIVLCPLCTISGCIYLLVFRCRGVGKVAVSPEPIPVLHVADGNTLFATVTTPHIAYAEVSPITDVQTMPPGAYVSCMEGTVALPLTSLPQSQSQPCHSQQACPYVFPQRAINVSVSTSSAFPTSRSPVPS
jgi:hypothetical protein